jgi:hypothetical protein
MHSRVLPPREEARERDAKGATDRAETLDAVLQSAVSALTVAKDSE